MSVKSKGLTVPDKSAADGANRGIRKYIRHNWQLWIMLFPAMLYILIFCYVPMYGIQLAFREYSFTAGITGGKFVGMKYFRQYFESPMFWTTPVSYTHLDVYKRQIYMDYCFFVVINNNYMI